MSTIFLILVTFTIFLARTFRKVWSACTLKNFCHSSYSFLVITHLLMDKYFPELTLRHIFKHNSWGLGGTGYRRFFIVEYLQPYNLQIMSNFNSTDSVSWFFYWKTIYKKLKKVSIKVQRMLISSFLGWISSFSVIPEMSSLCVFFGKRSSLLIWQKSNFIFVGKKIPSLPTYWKHHISMYFLGNIIFHFPSVKKKSYFRGKKMPSFLMI